MKKLMLVGAIVACAAVANASTVVWGLSSGTLDSKVSSGTAYLCYYTGSIDSWATDLAALTSYDRSTITGTMGMTVVQHQDGSDPKKDVSFAYSSATGSAKVNSSNMVIPGDLPGGVTDASFYYVVISDDGKNMAYTTSAKTGTINTSTTMKPLTVTTSAFSYATASAVPEPTSGLMLLLGVGLMALKRKRA